MEDAEQIDLEGRRLSLIDFSSENDSLIFTLSSPPPADKHQSIENLEDIKSSELLGAMDAGGKEYVSQEHDKNEHVPELAESVEPQRIRRNGKCNLRKSLAWDSAFFTSAGVLDPEELSSMIEVSEKPKKHLLPGIQEDTRTSVDSISTLESESLTLECLEGGLFEDIRASIQKSSKAVKNSRGKEATENAGNQDISPLKMDLDSEDRLKAKNVMKKMSGVQTSGLVKRQPNVSTGVQGSGKAMKPDTMRKLVPRAAARIRESTSSVPMPPKGISKVNTTAPAAAKRTFLGANGVKTEHAILKSVTGRVSHASKAPISSGTCRVLPKPASSSKSSSLGSSIISKPKSAKSSSTDASSGSASSENGGKSPLSAVRRKVATRVLNPPSSNSVAKTPSRNAPNIKSKPGNSALSAYLMSPKISSSISPASSISGWSSASSSSSSTVNQRSNKSRTSIGSSSCRSAENENHSLDLQILTDNRMKDGQENPGTISTYENRRKTSVPTGIASHSTSMKPTGLRMPSPKIGFFDGVKSVRTPNGTIQSHSGLPVVLSKTGSSTDGNANVRHRVGKLPPGRLKTTLGITKPETEKSNSSSSLKEDSEASSNLGVHDKKCEESSLKSEHFGSEKSAESKLNANSGFEVIGVKNLGVPNNEMSLDMNGSFNLKDFKIVGFEGECGDSDSNSSQYTSASERLDTSAVCGQHHLRSILDPFCKIDGKENLCEDQVDGSSKHVGGIQTDVNCLIVESLWNPEPMIPTCPTASNISSSRTPLPLKASLCNGTRIDMSHASADQVVKKAVENFPRVDDDLRERC